jgi:hypothetical protein
VPLSPQINELFLVLDTNGDGVVDQEEFLNGFYKFVGGVSEHCSTLGWSSWSTKTTLESFLCPWPRTDILFEAPVYLTILMLCAATAGQGRGHNHSRGCSYCCW